MVSERNQTVHERREIAVGGDKDELLARWSEQSPLQGMQRNFTVNGLEHVFCSRGIMWRVNKPEAVVQECLISVCGTRKRIHENHQIRTSSPQLPSQILDERGDALD